MLIRFREMVWSPSVESIFERCAEDAAFCDDGGDVAGGGYVEGGIFDADAIGGHLLAVGVSDFASVALFYGYAFACGGLRSRVDQGAAT